MAQNKEDNKEQSTEEHATKRFVKDLPKDKPATPEDIVDMMSGKILRFCIDKVPMPDVRRMINQDANNWVNSFNEDQRKEFSKLLRERFERMRQFMEAAHQEVVSVTSQIGW